MLANQPGQTVDVVMPDDESLDTAARTRSGPLTRES